MVFHTFGSFRLCPEERLLLRDGSPVALTPKAFDVLLALVRNAPRLVSKDELMSSVWPDTYVSEANLTLHISQLRKALGEGSGGESYIETIPKHGYRFLMPISNGASAVEAPAADHRAKPRKRLTLAVAGTVAALTLAISAYFVVARLRGPEVRTLAVLPLKPLHGGASEDPLATGIADAIITKVSQIANLTVRPTSAVRGYAKRDIEALQAARELQVEAVLDGTVQRNGERLRVSMNLLRVRDGASLWAENFNARLSDIFDVQDEIARRVATQLRVRLSPEETARLVRRGTNHPEAYMYYLKGIERFDSGWTPENLKNAVALFEKALELDPQYAQAAARLGIAYAGMAYRGDTRDEAWYDKAVIAIERAERLNSNLAETCLARGMLAFGYRGGNNTEETARQFRRAQELDPGGAHPDLGLAYAHLGLEDQAVRSLHRALEIDPLGNRSRLYYVQGLTFLGRFEDALEAHLRLYNQSEFAPALLAKGRLDEAQTLLERKRVMDPDSPDARANWALLLALRGQFAEAEAEGPGVLALVRDQTFHHAAMSMAAVFAVQGKTGEAVAWLRRAVETGLPSYPLFLRHPHLSRIRQEREFVAFLREQKDHWERRRREFSD
jgi:DNA-binding winged helix-turn-helix (wHTH) protein/TolB-like protein/Tfp pilus assembly protein PilF